MINYQCPNCPEEILYCSEYDSDEDMYFMSCDECGYSEWIETDDEVWK